jgi:radical SAM-linked protein
MAQVSSEVEESPARRGRCSEKDSTPVARLRIRFCKDGPLRFIGHNDLMRLWDRILRRARLPLRFSQGFHPLPRMSCPLSLGLGIVGAQEVLDVQLTEPIDVEDARRRLNAASVEGLTIVSLQALSLGERARVCRVEYECLAPDDAILATLAQRIAQVMSAPAAVVRRALPNHKVREINLRPNLLGIECIGRRLRFVVSVSAQGTARPEEVLRLLGVEHWLREGVIMARSRVVLDGQEACDTTSTAALSEKKA